MYKIKVNATNNALIEGILFEIVKKFLELWVIFWLKSRGERGLINKIEVNRTDS